jgi:hypothetical protein
VVLVCVVYVLYYTTQPNKHKGGVTTQPKRMRGLEKTRILVFFVFCVIIWWFESWSSGVVCFCFAMQNVFFLFFVCFLFFFVLFFFVFFCFFCFFWCFLMFFDTFFDFCFTGFELVFLMFLGVFLILFFNFNLIYLIF